MDASPRATNTDALPSVLSLGATLSMLGHDCREDCTRIGAFDARARFIRRPVCPVPVTVVVCSGIGRRPLPGWDGTRSLGGRRGRRVLAWLLRGGWAGERATPIRAACSCNARRSRRHPDRARRRQQTKRPVCGRPAATTSQRGDMRCDCPSMTGGCLPSSRASCGTPTRAWCCSFSTGQPSWSRRWHHSRSGRRTKVSAAGCTDRTIAAESPSLDHRRSTMSTQRTPRAASGVMHGC